jgi:hypothetical protein
MRFVSRALIAQRQPPLPFFTQVSPWHSQRGLDAERAAPSDGSSLAMLDGLIDCDSDALSQGNLQSRSLGASKPCPSSFSGSLQQVMLLVWLPYHALA